MVGTPFHGQPDIRLIALPDLLQLQVITEVPDLFLQGDKRFVTFIQHIFHQLRKFQYDVGRVIGFLDGQGIEIIQRIEQKMRVHLAAEIIDLSL